MGSGVAPVGKGLGMMTGVGGVGVGGIGVGGVGVVTGLKVVNTYVGSADVPAGMGVGRATPGVGARVLLVPWAATMGTARRATMSFIFNGIRFRWRDSFWCCSLMIERINSE